MHLVLSGNLPDRLDAHQGFQSDFGLKGTRVSFAFSSFAHGSAVLSRSAEPEKSNLGYCPKFGVHFRLHVAGGRRAHLFRWRYSVWELLSRRSAAARFD